MKLFKKSKIYLERFKKNAKLFFIEFRNMQGVYFHLLFKKRTELEEIEFKKVRKENFRLSIFIACWLAPIPFVGTLYFVLVPKFFWPNTLKKILNLPD